jgi:hypothetical protein
MHILENLGGRSACHLGNAPRTVGLGIWSLCHFFVAQRIIHYLVPVGDISACNIKLSVNNMALQVFEASQKCSINTKNYLKALKHGHAF